MAIDSTDLTALLREIEQGIAKLKADGHHTKARFYEATLDAIRPWLFNENRQAPYGRLVGLKTRVNEALRSGRPRLRLVDDPEQE